MKKQKPNTKCCSNTILLFLLVATLFLWAVRAQTSFGPPIQEDQYSVSRTLIDRTIKLGDLVEDIVIIENKAEGEMRLSIAVIGDVTPFIELDTPGLVVSAHNTSHFKVKLWGKQEGVYHGELLINGEINEKILINLTIVNETSKGEFLSSLEVVSNRQKLNKKIECSLHLQQIVPKRIHNISVEYILLDPSVNQTYLLDEELLSLDGVLQVRKSFDAPPSLKPGYYILQAQITHADLAPKSPASQLQLIQPFWSRSVFGLVPLWLIVMIIASIIVGVLGFIFIRKRIEARKKYKMQIYTATLPKKSATTLFLGKVAETSLPAYLDMNLFTTHGVVAGATGGGKSIAAQVLVEEALLKNIAVVVFDPTAQWSGMLRKCEDKRMLGLYSKFGLKENDARAFPGNVKQIKNAREAIDIKKYLAPGQIHIFALNKLDPADIDTFVASSIVSIFRSSPEEHPGLRVLLVFDEVHRLLPKFGGTGRGFLQIERACREFRKWGFGVLLVSQVLSDFVGEIKANINTEIQMRTRDESDLHRLKTKYGEEFLQSLIKASVGVGMFVNPTYNRGKPYFVAFRPILHNTRRLSDEILEKYFKYSEVIEDIEYQLEQLEAEKVDIFDLKMELKLIKDKLMTGNFTVVDIYLEGLTPRLQKQWGTLGKKPKARQLTLVAEADVSASIASAQAERAKWEKEHATATAPTEKVALDMSSKIVRPLTFDNGVSVSSLKELSDVLASLDASVFKLHVNKTKHEIADWIAKEIDAPLGAQVKAITDKAALSAALVAWITQQHTSKKNEENTTNNIKQTEAPAIQETVQNNKEEQNEKETKQTKKTSRKKK